MVLSMALPMALPMALLSYPGEEGSKARGRRLESKRACLRGVEGAWLACIGLAREDEAQWNLGESACARVCPQYVADWLQ